MNLYINAEKGSFSLNKKDYLLRAAKRLGLGYVRDVNQAETTPEYVLLEI